MMRASVCGSILEEHKFNDEAHWELEEESSQESKIKDEHNSGDQLPMGSVWSKSMLPAATQPYKNV